MSSFLRNKIIHKIQEIQEVTLAVSSSFLWLSLFLLGVDIGLKKLTLKVNEMGYSSHIDVN